MTCATVTCRDPAVDRGDQGSRIVTARPACPNRYSSLVPQVAGYGVYRSPPGVRLVGRPVMMRTRPPEQDRPTRLRVTASGMAGVVMAMAADGRLPTDGPREGRRQQARAHMPHRAH